MTNPISLEITHTTDIPDMQAIAATLLARAESGVSMAHLPNVLSCEADGVDFEISRRGSGFRVTVETDHGAHGFSVTPQALHQFACLAILALGVAGAKDAAARARNAGRAA